MKLKLTTAIPSLTGALSKGITWLVPHICISCQLNQASTNHPCCEQCYLELPFQPPSCHQCGQTFAARQETCGRCIASPPLYDRCFCPFEYEQPLNQQIRDFKYHQRPELAQSLGQLLVREIIATNQPLPELLIPVPLHLSRLRVRGYNQSLLLAKQIGKALGIAVESKAIIKSRKTAPQAELSMKLRANNLKGSFALKKAIRARSVAIIDDVVTTGSTTSEIAKILKRNGVDYVQVWGIAHTV